MLNHIVLSAVQMRIVLTLFLNGEVGTASLLQKVGMSGKTWSREKETLTALGVLASERRKSLSSSRVKVVHHHRLTTKGETIAGRIVEISDSLTPERLSQTALSSRH